MGMTWDDLADLRARGLKPELPVMVTDRPMYARNMEGVGCVAILHKSGERMPVNLLHGLDVWFTFARCELAGKVAALIRQRAVKPKSMRAWCHCHRTFTTTCGGCK